MSTAAVLSIQPPRPLRVLIFVEGGAAGGVGKTILKFCDTIASALVTDEKPPISVSLATFNRLSNNRTIAQMNNFVEAARRRALHVHILTERFRMDPNLFRLVKKLLREVEPDIIHTNSVKSHFLVNIGKSGTSIPWVAFHHGYTNTDIKMMLYNQLDRWSLRSADRVITVCGPFGARLLSAGILVERLRYVRNCGDLMRRASPDEIAQLRKRFKIAPETKMILTIGRLSREKGHRDLLHAVGHVRGSRPSLDFKALLVGFGPEEEHLRAEVKRLNLNSHVIVACNEPDVAPFFASADVFVLPSHSEGSPHVLFEAMASEVPIVATCVGGIPELLKDGETGVFARPKDYESLAASIIKVLEDKKLANRLAQNALQLMIQRFSPATSASQLLGVYRELIQHPAT